MLVKRYPVDCSHPFVISWFKYRLWKLYLQCILGMLPWAYVTSRNFHSFQKLPTVSLQSPGVWQMPVARDVCKKTLSLWWRHNRHGSVSNHQPHDCLLNRLFRRRSKKTSKLRVTGLCGIHRGPVNSPHKWPVTRKMFPFDDVIM